MPLLDGVVWFAGLVEAARGNSLELKAWAAELLESTDLFRGSVRVFATLRAGRTLVAARLAGVLSFVCVL